MGGPLPERDDLEQLVAERTGITTAIAREETSAFLAQQHIAEHWVAGRVVLLGDAAHELSPIGGQGMNLGLMDAAALAPRLVAALRGDADELVRWEGERRPAALRAMNQAAFNMAVGVPLPLLVQPLRRAAIRALSVPPVRRRLADAFTMQRL
ncbi:FAD-dependent oxidoreductase [Paramicrobacterium humi]|uniref:FAD-dependent oxidoreductase n=1 Tax=Paramicrobacterium humi TaxID=640635 RepID=UPI000B821A8A|nr:FAD-dependent monooxygenase [Microbacterium humi]